MTQDDNFCGAVGWESSYLSHNLSLRCCERHETVSLSKNVSSLFLQFLFSLQKCLLLSKLFFYQKKYSYFAKQSPKSSTGSSRRQRYRWDISLCCHLLGTCTRLLLQQHSNKSKSSFRKPNRKLLSEMMCALLSLTLRGCQKDDRGGRQQGASITHSKLFFPFVIGLFCLVKLVIRQHSAVKVPNEGASAWVWCDSRGLEEISSIFNRYHKQMWEKQVWWERRKESV